MTDSTAKSKRATYAFKVVVEPDDDAWHAWCPALRAYGAATWGRTREEALEHIREVVEMVVVELREDGETIPDEGRATEGARVSVTV